MESEAQVSDPKVSSIGLTHSRSQLTEDAWLTTAAVKINARERNRESIRINTSGSLRPDLKALFDLGTGLYRKWQWFPLFWLLDRSQRQGGLRASKAHLVRYGGRAWVLKIRRD